MNITSPFIKRPVMTTLLMLSLLFFGVVAYKKLPVSDLPNINFPAISVDVTYPGANPETVANNVISPLEREFLTIQGLQALVSKSSTGGGSIVLQFTLDRTIDSCAQDVQAAINDATPQLPKDLPFPPIYSKVNPSQTPIVYFALSSSTVPIYELYKYAYTYIVERLGTISGVAEVNVYGSPYAVRVQVNPQKLAAKNIGIDEVADAILAQNVIIPTGTLYGSSTEFTLQVNGQLNYADVYNAMIIKNNGGSIVRIQDIGKAIDSLTDDKKYWRYVAPGVDEATVIFGIQTGSGVNSMQVISDINSMLPMIESALPKSMKLYRLFDKSEFIIEAIDEVQFTLLIAFILVVFVIFVYLGQIKNTLIPALALPLSILGTFALMTLFGYTIDILSLLAITLSIGFLIDDAIVVLENIVRHVELGVPPLEAALQGGKEIGFTVLSMTLSLCSVFIPLIFMGGVIGTLFHEFAIIIVLAMLVSGFVSLSLTPLLCSRFIPKKEEKKQSKMEQFSNRLNQALIHHYEKALTVVLRHQRLTLALGAFSLIATVFLFKTLPTDFLPPDDVGFVVVHSQAADGTSPFQMIRYQEKLTKIVQQNPYVASLVSIGASPDDNKGGMYIRLKSMKERPSMPAVIKSLREDLQVLPGIEISIKPLPLIDLQVSTSDIKSPYQYTLMSLNSHDLYAAAPALIQEAKKIPGITQVTTDMELLQPQLNIDILRDRASVLGISARAIETALQYAYGAIYLSPINRPEYQYYAILEVEPKYYRDPTMLSQLYVKSLTNNLVPLTAFTKISQGIGPLSINRINGMPAVNLFFDTDKIPLGTAIAKLDALAHKNLPGSVIASVKGTADIFQASFANLDFLLLITFFVIYVILGILYENFFHPLTVMSTLPPAALGGLLTLILFHYPLSLYAFVGLILLLGIVMKNGIILVDFATASVMEGKSPLEAIKHAALVRFRPILMTTFSALMGAVPIAIGIGGLTAQGRKPLGLVIVGGLIFSQLLTLFLTPVIYLYLERLREWKKDKRKETS